MVNINQLNEKNSIKEVSIGEDKITVFPEKGVFYFIFLLAVLGILILGLTISKGFFVILFVLLSAVYFFLILIKFLFIKESWEFNRKTKTWKRTVKYLIGGEKIQTGNFNDLNTLELFNQVDIFLGRDYTWRLYLRMKNGKSIQLFAKTGLRHPISPKETKNLRESRELSIEAALFFIRFFGLKIRFRGLWFKGIPSRIEAYFPELIKYKV